MLVRRLSRTGVRTSSYHDTGKDLPEIEAYHCALVILRMSLQRYAHMSFPRKRDGGPDRGNV